MTVLLYIKYLLLFPVRKDIIANSVQSIRENNRPEDRMKILTNLIIDKTKVVIFLKHDLNICLYEGCSNMNVSSFITFVTYMLRQNGI